MTPDQEIAAHLVDINQRRAAYDQSDDRTWRAQHLGMIGLSLTALVRGIRRLIDQSDTVAGAAQLDDQAAVDTLEGRGYAYTSGAARVAAHSGVNWPQDVQLKLDADSTKLLSEADQILKDLLIIAQRYSPED